MTSLYATPSLDADLTWIDNGLCRGVDPDLFFPPRGESSAPAKDVCRQCPVCADCLEYALIVGERFGVWGGTSERERRRIRQQRRRAARRVPVRPGSMFTVIDGSKP